MSKRRETVKSDGVSTEEGLSNHEKHTTPVLMH